MNSCLQSNFFARSKCTRNSQFSPSKPGLRYHCTQSICTYIHTALEDWSWGANGTFLAIQALGLCSHPPCSWDNGRLLDRIPTNSRAGIQQGLTSRRAMLWGGRERLHVLSMKKLYNTIVYCKYHKCIALALTNNALGNFKYPWGVSRRWALVVSYPCTDARGLIELKTTTLHIGPKVTFPEKWS